MAASQVLSKLIEYKILILKDIGTVLSLKLQSKLIARIALSLVKLKALVNVSK